MSNVFKDSKGREWLIELNVGSLKRMASMVKFSLEDVVPKVIPTKDAAQKTATNYAEFLNDDIRFSEVLYAILKPQADAKEITHEQFDEGLAGEANQRAIMAFHGAFADFSQNPRRTLLRGMKIELRKAETKLAALDAMTDAELEAMMEKAKKNGTTEASGASWKSVTDTPDISELIQQR